MSRHQLEAREHTTREVVVGWDGRMGTFYGLVVSNDNTLLVDSCRKHWPIAPTA